MILIIDYGMSNLGSIRRALEECGADVIVSDNPDDLKNAERIVLPGVGSFADGMASLKNHGWIEAIKGEVLDNEIPILGICLGMQLLATRGFENGETDGLGLIQGEVVRMHAKDANERIPHVGWNEIHKVKENPLLESINDGSDFYFVHSYHFMPGNIEDVLTTTPYCGGFVSSVQRNNISGVQFHPEKSIPVGFQLLKNFLYNI